MKGKDAFENKSIRVPFFSPYITNEDRKVVLRTLKNTLLTDGPVLRNFESSFSEFTKSKYAVGVSNATSALHLSLKSLGIKKGDEVIIPDITFIATASAVMLTGAIPVLADVDLEDMNISIESIKKNISSKTKAILPVHFAGNCCDILEIKKLAKRNNLSIIEDCAHALGTSLNNIHVGCFGDAGCFSFYPTKNITSIEGGMIITNSKKINQYVLSARNHNLTRNLENRFTKGKPWEYDVLEPGYNYRLDEIRSALGINQLKRIKKINEHREKATNYYTKKLNKTEGIIPIQYDKRGKSSYHLYVIRITKDFHMSRNELFSKLLELGVRTTVHYKPLSMFTVIKKYSKKTLLKNSNLLYNEIISLPLFSNITRKEQDLVIKIINDN